MKALCYLSEKFDAFAEALVHHLCINGPSNAGESFLGRREREKVAF